MNSVVTSGFGDAGRSEKVILTAPGLAIGVVALLCFEIGGWLSAGLQPAARRPKAAARETDPKNIVFTSTKIGQSTRQFFEASQRIRFSHPAWLRPFGAMAESKVR
jgi:hypothetical protein